MKINLINENFQSFYGKNLLKSRGIEDLENFLYPTEKNLEDWKKLKNIEKGIELLDSKIKDNAHFVLLMDSDCDGFCSATIFYQFIKSINKNIKITLLLHEGKQHGLEDKWKEILDFEESIDLIITPDAGINDYEFHEKLKEIAPILVLDHHILNENQQISDNAVLIDNQISPEYLNKDACGAAITWQFCRGFAQTKGKGSYKNLIDLVGIATIGDMMDVRQLENRYYIVKGLESINNPFIRALLEKQSFLIGEKINPTSIAFYIVPLINAMIRVGTTEEKERMAQAFINGNELIESHKRGANGAMEKIAVESARECANAKSKQDRITIGALERIEQKIFKYDLLENTILFIRLDDEDKFPSEVNGLIANKLANQYKRPTIIARLNDGIDKGSIRAPQNSPLPCSSDLLLGSGYIDMCAGHDNSAGIALKDSNLHSLHSYANEKLAQYNFSESCYNVNFERRAADKDLCDIIYDLDTYKDVWGQKGAEPLIYVHDINLKRSDIQLIGKDKKTLKFSKNGITYIKFHAGDMIEELKQYGEIKINVVGRANLNEWNSIYTPQIQIENYEIKDNQYGF